MFDFIENLQVNVKHIQSSFVQFYSHIAKKSHIGPVRSSFKCARKLFCRFRRTTRMPTYCQSICNVFRTFPIRNRCVRVCILHTSALRCMYIGDISRTVIATLYTHKREESMQETQHTQQTATRTAQNQDKKTI